MSHNIKKQNAIYGIEHYPYGGSLRKIKSVLDQRTELRDYGTVDRFAPNQGVTPTMIATNPEKYLDSSAFYSITFIASKNINSSRNILPVGPFPEKIVAAWSKHAQLMAELAENTVHVTFLRANPADVGPVIIDEFVFAPGEEEDKNSDFMKAAPLFYEAAYEYKFMLDQAIATKVLEVAKHNRKAMTPK